MISRRRTVTSLSEKGESASRALGDSHSAGPDRYHDTSSRNSATGRISPSLLESLMS